MMTGWGETSLTAGIPVSAALRHASCRTVRRGAGDGSPTERHASATLCRGGGATGERKTAGRKVRSIRAVYARPDVIGVRTTCILPDMLHRRSQSRDQRARARLVRFCIAPRANLLL
jgi:hypothetical protein